MKKIIFLLILVVFLCGCVAEKTLKFKKPYDVVYTRTLSYAASKGWKVEKQNKQTGTIQISMLKYGNEERILNFVITPKGDSTQVYAKVDSNMKMYAPYMGGDTAIQEYVDYINK